MSNDKISDPGPFRVYPELRRVSYRRCRPLQRGVGRQVRAI